MASIFDKWNKQIDTNDLANKVKEAADNSKKTEREDVPYGNYVVRIEKMELKESKKGDPMFSAWFKVREGEHKDRYIFMNQIVLQPFQIHIVNELLRSLDTDVDVDFENYTQWNNMILDVHEATDRCEFDLDYYQTKNGFDAFQIKGVYDI